MNKSLDVLGALRSKRQRWVDANRENHFEAGILRLLTQLYPDNAHFIYELLQNAEDAGAAHVRFSLSADSLLFEHDGPRLFSLRDVESITSIGDSTKLDSPTQIGKFGVGFKAVFAYTQTPEVHSGDFHFRIRDLVVPDAAPLIDLRDGEFKTRFIFPFDHKRKRANHAVLEIDKALQSLSEATLLFLTNIRHIKYVLPNGSQGGVDRLGARGPADSADGSERIEVNVKHPQAGTSSTHWLRYQRKVSITDEAETKDCTLAIAFGLVQDEGKGKKPKWSIASLDPGRVSIYFPAEKETSNLRFHLHAPFASTVARDSVRSCEGNNQLRDALAQLVADSLEDIRDRGFLTIGALELLPIDDDNLPEFYDPIRGKIIEAFRSRNLVPTRSGEHRKCENLFRGPSDILNLLSDEDLAEITNHQWATPLWCANPPQLNQRADKFLDSLEIDDWGWEELGEALDCDSSTLVIKEDPGRPQRLQAWLDMKDDAWLRRLYAILNEATTRHGQSTDVAELAFVRVVAEKGFALVRPREAFFPPSDGELERDDILLVKLETYSSGKSEAQRNAARLFLESAGVRVFDEETDLTRVIETYVTGSFPDDKTHLEHVKRFVAFYKAHPKKKAVFSAHAILLGTKPNHEGKRYWCAAEKLCMDNPFEDTGLSSIEPKRGKFVLWDGYSTLGITKDFTEFAKAIGIQSALAIVHSSTYHNPAKDHLRQDFHRHGVRRTYTEIDNDWTVDGIDGFVRNPSIESSRLIWSAIIRADAKCALARFRPNQQYVIHEADSQLVCFLKGSEWIPDVDGVFHKPQDMARTSLRPDFPYDNRNGMLSAIGFEENIQRLTEEYKQREQAARDLGFEDLDAAAVVAKAMDDAGLDAKDAAALIRQHSPKPVQPEEGVRNPKRRRAGVLERRENAPERETVKRERSIQPGVPEVLAQARAYLRARYTNPDGQMVCQACQNEMPFKLASGDYYFEAVQCVKGLQQHFYENRLALCPTCAAMYLHARADSDDDLRRSIVTCEVDQGDAAFLLEIELAGETRTLRFVGTHFFDLKTVLEGPDPA